MKIRLIALVGLMLASTGCASLETRSNEYILIRPHGLNKPVPTVIMAHGCEGFSDSNGQGYRNRANLIAQRFDYNVILYDAFKPRGWTSDEVCTGARGANANAVPPILRVEDTKQIAQWIQKQSWHTGKISFIGYSHGGSVALAIANNPDASKLISSVVAYYPNCDSSYIGSRIDKPLIPALVHLGEQDNWTPIQGCLNHKDKPNYEMVVYKNATHAWDAGFNGTAIGKWPIRFNMDATHSAEIRTQEFFNKTLK
jgi:dienelactone hydrolase